MLVGQIKTITPASCPERGALAIVRNVGTGCGGRDSVGRGRQSQGGLVARERSAAAQTNGAVSVFANACRMCTARRASWRKWVADGEAVWSWRPVIFSFAKERIKCREI